MLKWKQEIGIHEDYWYSLNNWFSTSSNVFELTCSVSVFRLKIVTNIEVD